MALMGTVQAAVADGYCQQRYQVGEHVVDGHIRKATAEAVRLWVQQR